MDEVSVSIANENVENSDVTDVVTAIADDGLIDYVTGREVKDTAQGESPSADRTGTFS